VKRLTGEPMDKLAFRSLFLTQVQSAVALAGSVRPSSYRFELHGGGKKPRLCDLDSAIDDMYLGGDRFYRVITILAKSVDTDVGTIFVGLSGHEPSGLDKTWNQPPGVGPFHVVAPLSSSNAR